MPMERDRYPSDWEQLAANIRVQANHRCQHCGKECRRPGEKLSDFVLRRWGGFAEGREWNAARDAIDHPKKYCLTTAHLDQDPANNHPSNLKALCMVCHIQYDHPHLKRNAIAKRERRGQTKLPI
jgi:5-methylcytosine-specific restriction endonuclease McrA